MRVLEAQQSTRALSLVRGMALRLVRLGTTSESACSETLTTGSQSRVWNGPEISET